MKQALIIAAAPEEKLGYIRELYQKLNQPLVICADGGLRKARQLCIPCDLLMGDMDSGGSAADCRTVRFPAEKNYTDTQACLEEALRQGCGELFLVGACGGRLDHFLCNLHLLEAVEKQGAAAVLIDGNNKIQVFHDGEYEIPLEYQYFSLIPISEALYGITIENAKYPLTDAVAFRDDSLTVSNEPGTNRIVKIMIKTGKAFLVFSK